MTECTYTILKQHSEPVNAFYKYLNKYVLNMKLNELIDDILQELRNNNVAESEQISRRQIELWINTYRTYLIKQDLDKDRTINPQYIQTIPMHVSKVEEIPNHCEYIGDKKLPKLIDFNYRPGVVSVKDAFGNIIQVGSETKMKFQKYRRYTCKDYIAYVKGDQIYVEGDDNTLEYIEVDIIAENPTELVDCFNPEKDEYPLPQAMWSTVKQLIFTREIPWMISKPSDTTNDSEDDTQNRFKE